MEPTNSDVAEPWRAKDAPVLAAARRATQAVLSHDSRFKLYFRMLDTPVLSEVYIRGRGRLRHRRIQPSTRVVIEAFPSSGNTYCRQAFLMTNPDVAPNDICSHTHSPRIVKRAVEAGLPCIVVARDPRDAVASAVQRFHGIHIDSAFDYYDHYYRTLLPLRERFVVAPFNTVIKDFSAVIDECNATFGAAFATQVGAGVSNDMVLSDIEDRQRRKGVIPSSRLPAAEFLQNITPNQREAQERALDTYRRFVDE